MNLETTEIMTILDGNSKISSIIDKSEFSEGAKNAVIALLSNKDIDIVGPVKNDIPNTVITKDMCAVYTYQALITNGQYDTSLLSPISSSTANRVKLFGDNTLLKPISGDINTVDNIMRLVFKYLGPSIYIPDILSKSVKVNKEPTGSTNHLGIFKFKLIAEPTPKLSVKNANVNIRDPGPLGGSLKAEERIWLQAQTIPTENGVYIWHENHKPLTKIELIKSNVDKWFIPCDLSIFGQDKLGYDEVVKLKAGFENLEITTPPTNNYKATSDVNGCDTYTTMDELKHELTGYNYNMVFNDTIYELMVKILSVKNYNVAYMNYVKIIKLLIRAEYQYHAAKWVNNLTVHPIDKSSHVVNSKTFQQFLDATGLDKNIKANVMNSSGLITTEDLKSGITKKGDTVTEAVYNGYTDKQDVFNEVYNRKAWSQTAEMSDTFAKRDFFRHVIGMPPRMSPLTDSRIKIDVGATTPYDVYGRVYSENFIQYGSYISFTPCYPKFAPTMSSSEISAMAAIGMEGNEGKLLSAVNENAAGKKFGWTLFGVEYAGTEYKIMLQTLIKLACDLFKYGSKEGDILSKILTEDALKYDLFGFDMSGAMDGKMGDATKTFTNLLIYNNGPIEHSESLANSVGDSTIVGMLTNNQLSEIGREMSYMMKGKSLESKASETTLDATSGFIGQVFGVGTSVKNLMAGQLKVPKVWKNSDYTKSFNVKIRLTAPSGHPKVIFRRIIVPMLQLLPFVLPQQYTGKSFVTDSVVAPFIVQVYSKGLIACEMGMVTGIEINRFVETQSIDGLPTEMEINLHIEDLTPFLSVPTDKSTLTRADYHVSGIVPFLSTMAGVPLYRSDDQSIVETRLEQLHNFMGQKITTPGRFVVDLQAKSWQQLYNFTHNK